MGSERRNCARRILYSPEYLDMGADNGGVVVDLSEGGLRFQAVGRVEPDSDVPLSFSLGTGYRIDVQAHVVWVNPRGNSGGVAFKKLSSDSLSLIREWLAKPEAEHRAESVIATPEAEEEQPVPSPAETQIAAPVSLVAAPDVSVASPAPNSRSRVIEALDEPPQSTRVEETAAPDDPRIRAHFEREPRPLSTSPFRGAASPAAPRAGVAPRPPSAAPPAPKRKPAASSGAFSVVPSISAWGGTESPAPHLSSRANPLGSGAPPSPLRGGENIFARNRWQAAEMEERHPVRNFFLIVFALVIVGAVLAAIAWQRGYRQEIGAAIERVGSTVAGQDGASSAPPAPASSSAPSANSSGANSSPASAPKDSAPAPTLPGTTPSGSRTAAAGTLQGGAVPNAPATNSGSSAGTVSSSSDSPASAKPPAATQDSKSDARKPAQTPAQNPPQPQRPSAPANLKQASNQKPAQVANISAPSSAQLAQSAAQTEFLRGQQYLNGNGVPQDPATAAEWFWRSLEAGNTAAALPLADLYVAGKGVSRSCTQARILLDTAARKGNAEAAHKLAQLPANCD